MTSPETPDAIARFPDGTPLPAVHPSRETLELLEARRSAKWATVHGPGPSPAEIERLLAIASRVPDHGKLAPWRFIVIGEAARTAFGEVLARAWESREPGTLPERLALERARFANMPTTIVIVSRAQELIKIPMWEQELSAGAVGMLLLIAANAMGYTGSWITEWFAYDRNVKAALGLTSGERIAGYVGLGSVEQVVERARPRLADIVTNWTK